jgi:hypothetical protein
VSEDEIVAAWAAVNGHHSLQIIHMESFKRSPKDTRVNHATNLEMVADKLLTMRKAGLRPVRVYADLSNQIGFQDLLEDRGFVVEPVIWSATEKRDLMYHLQDCLGSRLITIPPRSTFHGERLIRQLQAYSYDITEFGNVRFNKREDGRTKNFNDDYVSAVAMLAKWLTSFETVKPSARIGRGKHERWGSLDFSKHDLRAIAALN